MRSKEEIKEYNKRYQKEHPEKCREIRIRYRTSEKGKENCRAYNNSEKNKGTGKRYSKSEKGRVTQLKARLKFNYGITVEEYYEMAERQNNCCAICRRHQNELNITLAVDHNHKTGEIRALLCGSCNRVLGIVEENINILEKMVVYLKQFNT